MFEITQLMSLNISIFIVIIGVILLYFGVIIGGTKVEKYDKTGYYGEGLIFFAIYLYIPTLFAYYIYSKNLLTISSSLSIGIQVIILIFLSWNLIANEIKRYELLDEIKKKVEERSNQITEQFGLSTIDYTKIIDLVYDKIPIKLFGNKAILMFFSFLTIISNIQLYAYEELLILGVSLLLAFFIFTMIAVAHGFSDAYHPPGKIYMVDGNTIEGIILKFGEFVYVLKDDKKIFINKDKISFVEESKFKIKK